MMARFFYKGNIRVGATRSTLAVRKLCYVYVYGVVRCHIVYHFYDLIYDLEVGGGAILCPGTLVYVVV